jgi:hypothetical protein
MPFAFVASRDMHNSKLLATLSDIVIGKHHPVLPFREKMQRDQGVGLPREISEKTLEAGRAFILMEGE